MLGIISVLAIGFVQKYIALFIVKFKEYQSLKVILNYFFMSIIFFIASVFSYDKLDFSFFIDPLFYTSIFFENITFVLALLNYNKQNNFSQISFASFSSIYVIIFLNYIYSKIFDLSAMISSPYKSNNELIIYSFVFFTLTVLFFKEKMKEKIKHPFLLFIFAFSLSNALFFAVNLMQTYQPLLVYSFVFLSMAIFFFNRVKSEKWRDF